MKYWEFANLLYSQISSLYWFESSNWLRSSGLETFIFIIQPFEYGSAFTSSGVSSKSSLNSIISPETGKNKSDTVFTASTVPKTSSASKVSPIVSTST